ncbi:hypothetical protein Acit_09990 [Aciditerrimonas ferrireducens]|nr:hypothetical protein [Aciditerrimonas ferrireducens]
MTSTCGASELVGGEPSGLTSFQATVAGGGGGSGGAEATGGGLFAATSGSGGAGASLTLDAAVQGTPILGYVLGCGGAGGTLQSAGPTAGAGTGGGAEGGGNGGGASALCLLTSTGQACTPTQLPPCSISTPAPCVLAVAGGGRWWGRGRQRRPARSRARERRQRGCRLHLGDRRERDPGRELVVEHLLRRWRWGRHDSAERDGWGWRRQRLDRRATRE